MEDQPTLVAVAVGGNLPGPLGDVRATLEAAVAALRGEGLKVTAQSRWWRSAAWPDPVDAPFLNGIVVAETRLSPSEVLQALQRIERGLGRDRGVRNAPRTVDLDLIAYGERELDTAELTLPHPRARERLFVTGPLAEVAPGWRWPNGVTAAELAQRATVGVDAVPTGRPPRHPRG